MSGPPTLVIDFDSTFIAVETLDVMADRAWRDDPDHERKRAEVAALTDRAMNGDISFGEALAQRLALLSADRSEVEPLIAELKTRVTASFQRNRAFFQRNADRVYVVSGGFAEVIRPIVAEYGLAADHVLANTLRYDAQDHIIGVDTDNPLSRNGGKVEVVRALSLKHPVVMIGDGWTDYEVRQAGAAERFHAFVENVSRPKVVEAADHVAASLDEVLHVEGLTGRFSYPRSRMRVLLLENIHPNAVERFRAEGYEVQTAKGALDENELVEQIGQAHILGIRSKTQLTARALEAADKLLAVGAFCIGTNQIDLAACSGRGVAVFNAPYSNTRSVVELAIGEMVALTRGIFDKSSAMHEGRWDKSASGSHEIRGKTLGLVGYGAIGSQLSVVAEALGLRVLFYDVGEKLAYGRAERVRSLHGLLAQCDFVSLHVDGRAANKHLIGAAELAAMKPGAILLNLSRGHVVDVPALAEALKSGHLWGAAVDVFPQEPKTNDEPFESVLKGLKNVILTPHVGGSTEEAQEDIADFASARLLGFLHRGDTTFSVNLPNVQLSEVEGAHRLLHIHRNQPGVLAGINGILSAGGVNILAQSLNTHGEVGYVITDVDRGYGREALDALRTLPGTLKFRTLY